MVQDANGVLAPITIVAALKREEDELVAPAHVLKEDDYSPGEAAGAPVLAPANLDAKSSLVLN